MDFETDPNKSADEGPSSMSLRCGSGLLGLPDQICPSSATHDGIHVGRNFFYQPKQSQYGVTFKCALFSLSKSPKVQHSLSFQART